MHIYVFTKHTYTYTHVYIYEERESARDTYSRLPYHVFVCQYTPCILMPHTRVLFRSGCVTVWCTQGRFRTMRALEYFRDNDYFRRLPTVQPSLPEPLTYLWYELRYASLLYLEFICGAYPPPYLG